MEGLLEAKIIEIRDENGVKWKYVDGIMRSVSLRIPVIGVLLYSSRVSLAGQDAINYRDQTEKGDELDDVR